MTQDLKDAMFNIVQACRAYKGTADEHDAIKASVELIKKELEEKYAPKTESKPEEKKDQ